MTCPHCGIDSHPVKAGRSGDQQRFKCSVCKRRYLLEPRERGYPLPLRQQALALYGQGVSVGTISRRLGVTGQSVRNWLRAGHTPEVPSMGNTRQAQSAPTDTLPLPEKKRPTIDDVARQAGVSRSTVSNLLNSKGRMSETTRAHVQAAMDALHFTPSALIRAIHRQRTRIIGVLIFGLPELGRSTAGPTSSMLAGVSAAADAAGHNMLLYTGWERGAGRQAALEFLDGHIDGLIWVAPALHEPALERLAEAGLPVVALLSRHVPEGVGYVNADNIGSMRGLVTTLGALGHRRIAYIGAERDSNFLDRRDGYRAGLAALGLPHDTTLEVQAEFSPDSFRAAVAALLSRSAPPTVIIAPSDSWANEIGNAIQKVGLRIPEDISVTGFDDSPNAERIFGGLTTVRQPFQQMGQFAGERLLALIAGAGAETCRLTLPTEQVIRASTGPPRDDQAGVTGASTWALRLGK